MLGKYLLFFVAMVSELNADDKDRYYVVESDNYAGNYYYPTFRGVAPKPYNFLNLFKNSPYQTERVKVQLYYECLCPDCRDFDTKQFKQTVLALGPYLDIHLYPYGNAQTEENNGHVEFTCQHGPAECYGNKLHACAIDQLKNMTVSVLYNSCLMDYSQEGRGSDDKAADVCGHSMDINSEPIKQCAKGPRGTTLLQYYGVESKKANFNSVPHILIDGVQNSGDNFMEDVCKSFVVPPPACNDLGFI